MFENIKVNIKDLFNKALAIIVLGLVAVFVLGILGSYIFFYKFLFRLPFYQIPIGLGVYACLSMVVFIKYAIIPHFSSQTLKQQDLAFYMIIIVSFVNYLVIYELIKPEVWFSNRAFLGLIFKVVFSSLS